MLSTVVQPLACSIPPMSTYWDRLKPEMDAKKLGIPGLADAMGISFQAVAKVRDGGDFGSKNNLKAAKIFGLEPEWLASGKGPKYLVASSEVKALTVEQSAPVYQVDARSDDLKIPQYAVGGSMGHGTLLGEKPPGLIKSWSVEREWVRRNVPVHSGIQNLCIVTGFGPSMKPLYNPGDPLLMDRGVNQVETEGVYFFRVGEDGYIKQVERIPTENGLVLRAKSLNPTYGSFDITKKMMGDFECFGKILTVWRSEQV